MIHLATRLLIVVLLLGWSFQYLFYDQSVGANFAVFASLCLAGGLFVLVGAGLRPARKSLLLALPVLFFAWVSPLRNETLTHGLAYAGALTTFGLLAVSCRGGRWTQYSLLDYLVRAFQLALAMLGQPIQFANQARAEWARRGDVAHSLPVGPVLRGFAIALPILFIFTTLLASADLVFQQQVDHFLAYFSIDKFAEYLMRLSAMLVSAYGLAGVFLYGALRSQDEHLIGEERPAIRPFLGFIEAAMVLSSVTALFLLFVIIQFQYFFGGQVNIGVEGFSYSEYARRGFNELLGVAFLSLLLVLGLGAISHRVSERQRRVFSGLSATLLALVLVILFSAYQRLWLAIDWHGFSRLRLYPLVFMVWLGILFVAVVGLEMAHRERYFALAALLVSLGFAASLVFINVDAAIVRVNVARAVQGKHFNVPHLAGLSTDAVPALVASFHDPAITGEIHEGLGAALSCFRYQLTDTTDKTQDWRSWDFSEYQARLALYQIGPELRDYGVNDDYWPVRVFAPAGEAYPCRP